MLRYGRTYQECCDGASLCRDVVVALFGEEVPLAVAVTALKELQRNSQTRVGVPAALLAQEILAEEIASRDREVADAGLPDFLWVVTASEEGKMLVSVEERITVAGRHLGLVAVVDVRRPNRHTEEG